MSFKSYKDLDKIRSNPLSVIPVVDWMTCLDWMRLLNFHVRDFTCRSTLTVGENNLTNLYRELWCPCINVRN